MAAGTALKKIQARVKQLRKKHPGAKFRTLQKQAGAEYRSGKLKAKRKAAPKRKPAKRKAAKRKVAAVGAVRRKKRVLRPRVVVIASPRKRRRKATKKKTTRRRVSGTKSNMGMLLGLGALAIGAYVLLKPKTPTVIYTSNQTRNNQAANLLAYAQAAGMTAAAIANLIKQINASNDAQVAAAAAAAAAAPNQDLNSLFPGSTLGENVGSYLVR